MNSITDNAATEPVEDDDNTTEQLREAVAEDIQTGLSRLAATGLAPFIPGLAQVTYKPVAVLWSQVMNDVQKVAKNQTADMGRGGSYQFRGVDAVVNAVGPALREHGVIVLPKKILKVEPVEYETKNGGRMVNKQVTVRWEVRGPAGDTFTGESVGEAADSGDKSIAKAQSVAYRVFLLQSLCIPSGDRDPDYDNHERASAGSRPGDVDPALQAEIDAANEARGELLEATRGFGWDEDRLVRRYWDDYRKNLRNTRDVTMIQQFKAALVEEGNAAKAQAGRAQIERDTVAAAQAADAAEGNSGAPVPPEPISDRQVRDLNIRLSKAGITGNQRHQWCSEALGMEVTSTKNLTGEEYERLITKLNQIDPE